MPERTSRSHGFEQLWREPADRPEPRCGFAIDCASGTYVRSLVADLGDAYCLELRRTAIGPFEVADAIGAAAARGEPWREPPPAPALPGARRRARPHAVRGERLTRRH